MYRFSMLLLLVSSINPDLAAAQSFPEDAWIPLAYDESKTPADNPLKGFVPFSGEYESFPHSMEFDYVGFATLMSGPETFTFDTGLEPLLNEIAGRGHQAIIRVYLDYPDTDTSVPQFLLDAGVTLTPYNGSSGQGMSPDYDNENLVSALETFIAAFGARYDGDPRIGFIQLGILGHWGEWHTFPEEELLPSVTTQNRVLTAYDTAFSQTQILVSQDILGHDPMAAITGKNIGFHDDDFTNATLPTADFHFWSRMQANGLDTLWQSLPNGGEVQPDFQDVVFDQPSGAPEDFSACVDTTHVSWLLYHQAFEGEGGGANGWDASKVQRAIAGAKRTGYELYVSEVNLPDAFVDGALAFGVRIQNRGVAPFSYNWPFHITAMNEHGLTHTLDSPDWALSSIAADGTSHEFVYGLANHPLPTGRYTLTLSVPNPLAVGAPIRFANAAETGAGVILGSIDVNDSGMEGEGEGELLATLIVHVTDAQTDSPIHNATLTFNDETIPDPILGVDGIYTYPSIPFGRYTLTVGAPAYREQSTSIDVDQLIVSLDVGLQREASAGNLERIADDLLTSFADLDENDDNRLSLEEARVEEPTLTGEQFDALDANSDGGLTETELRLQLPPGGGSTCPLLGGKVKRFHTGDVYLLGLAVALLLLWPVRTARIG